MHEVDAGPTKRSASHQAVVVAILASLIGIGAHRHPDLRDGLRSRPIVPMVVLVIAMRMGRVIRQHARSLIGNIGLLRSAHEPDEHRATQSSNVVASSANHAERQALLLPQPAGDRVFPKLIFQTWKSKVSVPDHFARWSASLRQLNSDYRYILWDDADNRNFIETYYPWFSPIYNTYPREIYRADAVRYFFLYHFGGIYVDMDTECLRPLGSLFDSGDVWLGRMGTDREFPHSIPNAIMASLPLQEFWLLAISLLIENAETYNAAAPTAGPETMTGPILLKRTYDVYTSRDTRRVREMIQRIASQLPGNLQPRATKSQLRILESDEWYPLDWSNIIHLRLCREAVDTAVNATIKRWVFPNAFFVTFWTHSW